MSRKPRHLSPEERALWDRVARTTDRKFPEPERQRARERTIPKAGSDTPAAPQLAPFRVGEKAAPGRPHDLLAPLAEQLSRQALSMDAKAYGRMKKGKLKPEARVDLHGMTQDEAHGALTDFILTSRARGRRLVLVITGKGRMRDDLAPMPVRDGLLRHQVPRWLALAPLASAVLQIAPAHQRHGGAGAYYVYLRKLG